jgi:hypothetical protein
MILNCWGGKSDGKMLNREVLMTSKKISTRELVDRFNAIRKRRPTPAAIENFNKIMDEDEKHEREKKRKRDKKIARPPEADL